MVAHLFTALIAAKLWFMSGSKNFLEYDVKYGTRLAHIFTALIAAKF